MLSSKKYLAEQFRHGFWRVKMYLDHPKMSLGDDYTFWKDILEPPLVLGILLALLFGFVCPSLFFFVIILSVFLLMMEIFYGILITKNPNEGIFFAAVMTCRSFARAFGFCSGLIHFFVKKLSKKVK